LRKNRISKNWINKQKRDPYFKKSKIEGYRSRSAYKLLEINDKFKILKNNISLLDLGSSPGGWSQVSSKFVKKGKILAVDTKNMDSIYGVKFILGDINDQELIAKIKNYFDNKIDVIISDMATNTTGNKNLDSYRTGELCLNAMELATKLLDKEGVFLSKVFMGSVFTEINEKAKKSFKKVIKYKPLSSRKESKEIYIFCKGLSII